MGHSTDDKCKAQYRPMEAPHLAKMRELETENAKLKKMFAEVSLQNMALKDIVEKSYHASAAQGVGSVCGS